jgi:hypothetical protein
MKATEVYRITKATFRKHVRFVTHLELSKKLDADMGAAEDQMQ